MGSVWKIGVVNCHISRITNLDKLLIVVKFLKVEICGVVETWLKGGEGEKKMEKILHETEWTWVGKERKGRRGGGVGFLVKKEVRARVAKTTRAEGLLWVETEDRRGKIFLALVYLAPGTFPRV